MIINSIRLLAFIILFVIIIIRDIPFKKIFKEMLIQETFLEYRTESNSIELVRSNRIEFFQYFDVFLSSVRSNRTHRNHSNASNTSCKSI